MINLPKKFVNNVVQTWGAKGKEWLTSLPELLSYFINKWQLKDFTVVDNLSFNYVLFGFSKIYKQDVVLKISFSSKELFCEQKALQNFNGVGCVKLLDCDLSKGGLLIERIKPGISLKSLFPEEDFKATHIACKVIKKLHLQDTVTPEINEFPSIYDWLKALEKSYGDQIPIHFLSKARTLANQLLRTQSKLYLLHGDLHHENILQSKTDWLAIDPKGVIGELEYETGAFIINPMLELLDEKNPKNVILNRINQFSKFFNFSRKRLINWSFVQAVLSACWSVNNDKDLNYLINCASLIDSLTYIKDK